MRPELRRGDRNKQEAVQFSVTVMLQSRANVGEHHSSRRCDEQEVSGKIARLIILQLLDTKEHPLNHT